MLASELILDARRELLEVSGAFYSDAELIRLINRAEIDFVNRTRILDDQAYLTLTQGRSSYGLPSNFMSMRLVLHNQPDSNGNPDWRRILPSNLEKQAQEQPNLLATDALDQDRPRQYYIWQGALNLLPPPDDKSSANGTQLRIFYKANPRPITATSDTLNLPEPLSDGTLAFVLWKAWLKRGEVARAEDKKAEYFEYVAQGRRWLKKLSGDQRFRLDIDSPGGFRNFSPGFNPLQP